MLDDGTNSVEKPRLVHLTPNQSIVEMGLMSSQVDTTLGLEESITGLNIIIRTESPGRIPYPPRQVSCLDAPRA